MAHLPVPSPVEADLSRELTRIISCQYPASLSKLADIIARADSLTIRACVRDQPPCAVRKLAAAVSDALPHWEYAVRVLQSLSHSVEFRDEVLCQNAGLLNGLLTKANSSQRDFDEYAELCVLLLSCPLPDALPLPASAQDFFLRIFQQAVDSPEVGALKAVYHMLEGACKGLLALLPAEARHSFDRGLSQILKSSSTGQNPMLFLWCIGIVVLSEHHDLVGPVVTAERQWSSPSARKLFGSSEGVYKTINLTYLNVTLAVKGDGGVPEADVVEGVRIAVRTLQCIDRDVRERWPTTSPRAKDAFSRLPSKVLRSDINPAVQMEAMCFYAMVAGEDNLSADVVNQYEVALLHVARLGNVDTVRESLFVSLPLLASHIKESTFCTLLSRILTASVSKASSREYAMYKALVDQFTAMVPVCAPLRSRILHALSSGMEGSLQEFLQARTVQSVQNWLCSTFTAHLQRSLQSAILAMLLTSVITSQPPDPTIPSSLAVALVKKQQEIPNVASQCSHAAASIAQPPISLFQQKCTPSTGEHLQDWKDRLWSDLNNQSSYQRESLVRHVAQICQDLEVRCETVEEPLRQERQISNALTAEVSKLTEQVSSLMTHAFDRTTYIDGLQAEIDEKDEAITELERRLETEKEEATTLLKGLRVELQNATRRADETLRAVREDFDAKESEFRSALLAREESLHAREREVKTLDDTMVLLRSNLQEKVLEMTSLIELHQNLESRVHDVEGVLQDERQIAFDQANEMRLLRDEKTKLEGQLYTTNDEVESVTKHLTELQHRHQALIGSSKEALQKLEVKHENDMEAFSTRAKAEYNKLDQDLKEASQKVAETVDAYNKTYRELGDFQASVTVLEAQIEELTNLCSEKDAELHELRIIRRKVLASVGFGDEAAPFRAGPRSDDLIESHTPSHHRRKSAKIQAIVQDAPMGTQYVSHTALDTAADVPFPSSGSLLTRSGPSLKYSKPRSKVPVLHTPYRNNPIAKPSSRKSPSTKRPGLQELSPNRRHTSAGFTAPEADDGVECELDSMVLGKRRASLRDAEQFEFDMDDFEASTPFTPGNFTTGTGRAPDETFVTQEL